MYTQKKSKERLIATASNINSNKNNLRTNSKITIKKNPENKNGKRSKCMDTSRDKLKKFQMRWAGHG